LKSFKTSKIEMLLQLILLSLLIMLLAQQDNYSDLIRCTILVLVISILVMLIINSFIKKVIINNDHIIVKDLFRKSMLVIKDIDFINPISSLTRYIIILSDGNKTTTLTSHTVGVEEILSYLRERVSIETQEKIDKLKLTNLKKKWITNNLFIIVMIGLVAYAILKSLQLLPQY